MMKMAMQPGLRNTQIKIGLILIKNIFNLFIIKFFLISNSKS